MPPVIAGSIDFSAREKEEDDAEEAEDHNQARRAGNQLREKDGEDQAVDGDFYDPGQGLILPGWTGRRRDILAA